MKRKIVSTGMVVSGILILVCAGCTPKTSAGEDEVAKITLGQLAENKQQEIDQVLELNYDNLYFSQSFDFTVPEEIGEYEISCIDGFQDKWDALAAAYIPTELYDESKVVMDEKHIPIGPEFSDEQTGMYVTVGNTGFFSYQKDNSEDVQEAMYESDQCEKKTYYLNGEYADDTYATSSGDVSISEAVSDARTFAADFCKTAGYPQELRPQTAIAYQGTNKSTVINVRFNSVYKGVPIYNIPSVFEDLSFDLFGQVYAESYSNEKGNINAFTVQSAYEDHKTIETYDRIISPKDAVSFLHDKLSEKVKYSAVGMELVYCPKLEEKEDDTTENNVEAGKILNLSPYWAIYIDVKPSMEIYGLVNCITGDVEFVNNQR